MLSPEEGLTTGVASLHAFHSSHFICHDWAMLQSNMRADREPQDAPCVVSVQLRFQHRPEWVQPGQTVLMRDRTDNCLAAAGLITHTSRGC